ncbi:hypothetical protein B0O99DRAFT_589063 [Bisporella sp. PMI_857]|nr:hypothetical protein B0O99DRAFT_589063 [Bisporella sp. PMI_857]
MSGSWSPLATASVEQGSTPSIAPENELRGDAQGKALSSQADPFKVLRDRLAKGETGSSDWKDEPERLEKEAGAGKEEHEELDLGNFVSTYKDWVQGYEGLSMRSQVQKCFVSAYKAEHGRINLLEDPRFELGDLLITYETYPEDLTGMSEEEKNGHYGQILQRYRDFMDIDEEYQAHIAESGWDNEYFRSAGDYYFGDSLEDIGRKELIVFIKEYMDVKRIISAYVGDFFKAHDYRYGKENVPTEWQGETDDGAEVEGLDRRNLEKEAAIFYNNIAAKDRDICDKVFQLVYQRKRGIKPRRQDVKNARDWFEKETEPFREGSSDNETEKIRNQAEAERHQVHTAKHSSHPMTPRGKCANCVEDEISDSDSLFGSAEDSDGEPDKQVEGTGIEVEDISSPAQDEEPSMHPRHASSPSQQKRPRPEEGDQNLDERSSDSSPPTKRIKHANVDFVAEDEVDYGDEPIPIPSPGKPKNAHMTEEYDPRNPRLASRIMTRVSTTVQTTAQQKEISTTRITDLGPPSPFSPLQPHAPPPTPATASADAGPPPSGKPPRPAQPAADMPDANANANSNANADAHGHGHARTAATQPKPKTRKHPPPARENASPARDRTPLPSSPTPAAETPRTNGAGGEGSAEGPWEGIEDAETETGTGTDGRRRCGFGGTRSGRACRNVVKGEKSGCYRHAGRLWVRDL